MVFTHSDVTTCSNVTDLEHILATLLDQAPSALMDDTIPIFCACFHEAGVTNTSDFVSINPSTYGTLFFSTTRDATTKHSQLNLIQIKNLSSLFHGSTNSLLLQQPAGLNLPTIYFGFGVHNLTSYYLHLLHLPLLHTFPSSPTSVRV
jgi:hypothetical protein